MDVLFERKISARKFHKTEVDEFEETVDEKIINQYGDVNAAAAAQESAKA
jgi:hypothetical protein